MRQADQIRASNRALIENLFNGLPPYTANEVEQNRIITNVNDLTASRLFFDTTKQFSNAFLKAGNYFTVRLTCGPTHKRDEWSRIITTEINRVMKKSQRYRQTLRNVFAQLVLHGIGPASWGTPQMWIPTMHQLCDVLIPSQTLLTMENLSHFAIYRRYTAAQLAQKISGPRVDKGWNKGVVAKCIEWSEKQYGGTISGADWNWTPERIAEAVKENSGMYSADQVPTVNCWDFYHISDDEHNTGWRRRIVLDIPSRSETSDDDSRKITANTKNIIGGRDQFLYTSGERNYADTLDEIIHFQFADGSVVAPFRYHSVRSQGFLVYALCHMHNRLRCKIVDATFENLLQYIRVNSVDDAERVKKIDLISQGFLPPDWQFVNQNERWQVNQNLVQLMLNLNQRQLSESSPNFNDNFGQRGSSEVEKTATQITAELNKASATVGTILQEAYGYQETQYRENCRRFCIPNSRDKDVREFRAACVRQDVPVDYLDVNKWDVSADRVMGNGNKQLEVAQAQQVMSIYQVLDPDAQQIAKRDFLFAVTDDPAKVNMLVPSQKQVSNSVHDAQLAASTLLLGLPMDLKQGVNHGEYAATLLGMMQSMIQRISQSGGVGTPDQIIGLQNLAGQTIQGQPIPGNGAMAHIQILSQDKESKSEVKKLSDVLGKLMNEVRAFAQRQQEAQQQQNGNGNQLPPEDAVKLKAQLVLAETKAANMKASHDQRMQQRQQTHEMQLEQQRASDQLANANEIRKSQVGEAVEDLKTAAEIRRQNGETQTVE